LYNGKDKKDLFQGKRMVPTILGLILLLMLVLVAVRLISLKRTPSEESTGESVSAQGPIIHNSGIYSIVRNSPREDVLSIRPRESEIRKYIASINEDLYGRALSAADKDAIVRKWLASVEENISAIEKGDSENREFYYIESSTDKQCPVCASFFKQGQFVMRQEIYKNPSVIPPFHLGCTTRIVPYIGKENLRETTTIRMSPLFDRGNAPTLPEWKKTIAPR
jgi:hypothetical protein